MIKFNVNIQCLNSNKNHNYRFQEQEKIPYNKTSLKNKLTYRSLVKKLMKVKVNNQKLINGKQSAIATQINNHQKQKQIIIQRRKKPVIKLEVNRLVKKQNIKTIFINNKINSNNHSSLPTKFSLQSIQTYPQQENQQNRPIHTTSISEKAQKNNKSTKTFQQLYFEKLKENKLKKQLEIILSSQQTNKTNQKSTDVTKIQPSSCKNFNNYSINLPNSQKIINQQNLSKHPHSTKNAYNKSIYHSVTNKQNILTQNCTSNQEKQNKRNSYEGKDKFFKKSQKNIKQKQNVLKELRNSKQRYKSQQKQQKGITNNKKILKIRKSINNNQFNSHHNSTQQLNPKQKQKSNKNSIIQNSSKSTISEEEQKYRIKYEQFFQDRIKNIINHQCHQHVWGQTQCFVSYQQFVCILQNLGILTNKIESTFYIDKLWSNLGGNLYGGVVKYNISKFIFIIFFDRKNAQDIINQNLSTSTQNYITKADNFKNTQCFVDQSTLKLNSLSQSQKSLIRKFYYHLKSQKLNQLKQLIQKSLQKQIQNKYQSHVTSFTQDQKTKFYKKQFIQKESQQILNSKHQKNQQQLMNNLYTQQNLYTCKQHQYVSNMSPKINQNNQNTSINPANLVADFSPKLSKQQFQPFKSTILVKQQNKHLFNSQNSSEKQEESKQFQSLEIHDKPQKPKGKPLLSVDVNLGQGNIQKLIVYQGQTPYEVSLQLKQKYNVDESLRQKFQKLLQNHLKTLLFKIDQVCEQLFQDSREFLPGEYGKKTIQQ